MTKGTIAGGNGVVRPAPDHENIGFMPRQKSRYEADLPNWECYKLKAVRIFAGRNCRNKTEIKERRL